MIRVVFLTSAASLASCSSIESPRLKSIENLRTVHSDRNLMHLEADATFFNPNPGNIKMTGAILRISINEALVALIKQRERIGIKGQSEFVIPLKATISVDHFADLALKNMGSIFSGKPLTIELSGELRIKRFGIIQNIPIEYKQEVSPDFLAPF